MIFVTVGTHEQPFNRLVEYMDQWAEKHEEPVVIQTGYSTYEPKHCEWSSMYSYDRMLKWVDDARIIITHGGPSSYFMSLRVGKVPIVVPRKAEYNEHVNDHQVDYCREVEKRQGNIIVIEDIEKLGDVLDRYDEIAAAMQSALASNNVRFCLEFEKIVNDLMNIKSEPSEGTNR